MSRTQLGFRLTIPAVLLAIGAAGVYSYMTVGATAPTVTTVLVTRGDVVQSIATTGTLEAVTTVQVGTQVSGTVKELLADFNDIVRKGQVLARLDPALLKAQVEQAEASLVKAKADAERSRVALDSARVTFTRSATLAARSLISAADLEAASIDVRMAEAQLKSAEAAVTQAEASRDQALVNLDHAVITAPIDAVVISRNVDAGQTVAASMSSPTLFVLAADLTRMRVNAKLDESDVANVRAGQDVTFRVDAYPGETFHGRVAQVRLQGEVVSNVVTYTTVMDATNPELKLKPGMTANVTVEVARSEEVLRVPNAALRFQPTAEQLAAFGVTGEGAVTRAGGKGERTTAVWRQVGTAVERLVVRAGITDGTMTEVAGALEPGDRLVTALATGATVTAKTAASASSTVRNPLIGSGMPGPPPGR
jgi:HlyD family secretion protein